MCEDCERRTISRRQILWTPPLALGAALLPDAPAHAAERTVQRICRAAWGARPPRGVFVPHEINRVTVHHSAVALRDNRKAPGQLRAFQADHQARGWPDIAYHLLIDRHGNVYQGRAFSVAGDSNTSYDPRGHLLVLAMGNFQVQGVASAQLNALVSVLAWACSTYGVAPGAIRGHRAYASTLCPGDRLQRYISDGTIRRRVTQQLGQVNLRYLCGAPGRRRVRRIENGTD